MGLFDFLKPNQELKKNDALENIRRHIFPKGQTQVEQETRELRGHLQYKYTKDEVFNTYVHAAGMYYVTVDKDQEKIVATILHHPKSVVNKDDAIKIYLFLKQKFSLFDRTRSELLISNKYGGLPAFVKDVYINSLKEYGYSKTVIKQLIEGLHVRRKDEGIKLNMHIDDTPSSLMITWTKEYLAELESIEIKDNNLLRTILSRNPELAIIVKNGNKSEIEKYLELNPDKLDMLMTEIANSSTFDDEMVNDTDEDEFDDDTNDDDPAGEYLNASIDLIAKEDYITAYDLINKALIYNEKYYNSQLYSLRAECKMNLDQLLPALYDMDKAIEAFNDEVDGYEHRIDCYLQRAEINFKLQDYAEAAIDRMKADELEDRWKGRSNN
ncbi:hypothetical protein FVR03_22970 [Pontibacter qinzhouensis]|uniref:Tetratricopeptide repeat protein n=1 Tax=Pontibacter qinzhouensis TaxID=2603253 RepID=A0A5C8IN32_9BACT|nr:hypothetical protein [Pontibacter qinzhouensis]TXK22474.1 hypothetical protein FVR03_22970 [Pontibacter qinzhouensis]